MNELLEHRTTTLRFVQGVDRRLSIAANRPVPVDLEAIKPLDGERQHLLIQEHTPPDMAGYVLCATCVFFLANPLFGALAFIFAGKNVLLNSSWCPRYLWRWRHYVSVWAPCRSVRGSVSVLPYPEYSNAAT